MTLGQVAVDELRLDVDALDLEAVGWGGIVDGLAQSVETGPCR